MEQVACMEMEIGKMKVFVSNKDLHPGGSFEGRVELNLQDDSLFRGIWVKFCGKITIMNARKGSKYRDSSGDGTTEVDLLEKEDEYYHGGVHDVLLGLGEEGPNGPDGEEEESALISLEAGQHSWDFTFTVPKGPTTTPTR
jgi:hypothetical protein